MNNEKKKFEVNTICERCNTQMFPFEMPKSNNELVRLMKNTYDYKKPFIIAKKVFCKQIRMTYIRFMCDKCKFEKMVKLEEIFANGFIDGNICKKCPLDNCLWINCKRGGYLKGDN